MGSRPDLAQGGPSWCDREDKSEREFAIRIDPGLAIVNESVNGASVGQPYTETLTAKQVTTLNPPTGSDVQASWSLESGVLPPGLALSPQGLLTGTPTTEGSWGFVIRAQNGSTNRFAGLCARRPPAPEREISVRAGAAAEQRSRDSSREDLHRNGRKGPYTWAVASGALPPGVVLDATKGTVAGTPLKAGAFAFSVTATDSEGRVATSAAALTVAPRLTIRTLRLKPAKVASTYQLKLATRWRRPAREMERR